MRADAQSQAGISSWQGRRRQWEGCGKAKRQAEKSLELRISRVPGWACTSAIDSTYW